jgi:ligand-binding SRPBCC domain-containing protein
MSIQVLRREIFIPHSRTRVFSFFADARNIERITPPWLHFHVVDPAAIAMRNGATIRYKLRIRGVPATWVSEIVEWDPPNGFVDIQRKGPYKSWRHRHRFEEEDNGTRMVDEVRYELPFGVLGNIVHRLIVRRDVERIFNYRNACIPALIEVE